MIWGVPVLLWINYIYEQAQRLGCSKSGIEAALKRLGITQKKDIKPT